MALVYQHIRKDTNEVFYIGIGKTEKRAYSTDRTQYWKNIVNKHGYSVEIIKDGLSWIEACELETKLIKEYGRKDLGKGNLINMTDGGEGGYGVSNETIYKRGLKTIGKKRSEEVKQKLSEIKLKNPVRYWLGKTHSDISKEKMSINNGKWMKGKFGKDNPNSKPINQYSKDGKFIKQFSSASEASRELRVNVQSISMCCRGITKTSSGYKWSFI